MPDEMNNRWQDRLPKNNTIAMRLSDEAAEKIAKLAFDNGIKTTRQAKLLLMDGLELAEKGTKVTVSSEQPKPVMKAVEELRADEVGLLEQAAKKHGRTTEQQIRRSLIDGLELQDAIGAVSDYLSKTPPPFSPANWKPSESECLTFIKQCIYEGISKKQGE